MNRRLNLKTVIAVAPPSAASVWRGPFVKGTFVLAGLAILAFAGHGAAAMAEAPVAAAAESPVLVLPETVVTGQVPVAQAVVAPAPAAEVADAGPSDRIVLNEATAADLEKLPGIGVKKAALVVALRQKLGRFHAVEDLLKVKGLGRKRLAKIRPLVTVDRS